MPAARPNGHDSDTGPAGRPTVKGHHQSETAPASCKMKLGNDARMNACWDYLLHPTFGRILGDVFGVSGKVFVENNEVKIIPQKLQKSAKYSVTIATHKSVFNA